MTMFAEISIILTRYIKILKENQSFSHVQLFVTPWPVAHQAPLSIGYFWQDTEVGCHSLPQGNLPEPGIKPMSPVAPAL